MEEIIRLNREGNTIGAYKLLSEFTGEKTAKYYEQLLISSWYTRDNEIMLKSYTECSNAMSDEIDVELTVSNLNFYLEDLKLTNLYEKIVCIYCYKSNFLWDMQTKGLNGSEEAIVYLSNSLVKLGYKVIVFANPPKNSMDRLIFSNPHFTDCDNYNTYVSKYMGGKFSATLIWRQTDKNALSVFSEKTYLWLHDMLEYTAFDGKNLIGIDRVLWLSNYQHLNALLFNKELIKHEIKNGFENFANGIVPEHFMKVKEKKKKSCIYASNYLRGLEVLLSVWPAVVAEVPEARLKIYYGRNTWTSGAHVDRIMKNIDNMIKALPSVEECGSVDHETLAEKFLESEYWLYPCTYPETFCITALKAQLSDAIPVYFNNSALKETILYGVYISPRDGELCSPEMIDSYKSLAINMLKGDHSEQLKVLKAEEKKKEIIEKYSWDALAKKLL